MNYLIIQKIFNDGTREEDFKNFNNLLEAKYETCLELSKVYSTKNLEMVKVTILDNDLNPIFHDTNGESIFDIKVS